MAHVFISYKREDKLFVQVLSAKLEQSLKEVGIEVWWDAELKVGDYWSDKIDSSIENAMAVIVVLSPRAKASEYVTYEWAYALGIGIPVLPILFEQTELHPRLRELNYSSYPTKGDAAFQDIVDRVKEMAQNGGAKPARRPSSAPSGAFGVNWLEQGQRRNEQGNPQGALEAFQHALELADDASQPVICYQIGLTYAVKLDDAQKGDEYLREAETNLLKALQIKPGYVEALATLGLTYSLMARRAPKDSAQAREYYAKAEAKLQEALNAAPKLLDHEGEAWEAALGGVYKRIGLLDQAVQAYERATQITPRSSYPYSNLGSLYMRQNNRSKMLATYSKVERYARQKSDFWAYSDYLVALVAQGKFTLVGAALEDVLAEAPANAPWMLHSLIDTLDQLDEVLPEYKTDIGAVMERIRQHIASLSNG